jgi:hypothetical protein
VHGPLAAALELFRQATSAAPDELACDIVLINLPDGTPIVGMNICYNGPIAEGENVVRPLRSAGSPVLGQVGPIPYTSAQQLLDSFYPFGLQSYWKSSFLKEISDGAIDTMVAYCGERPTPVCHGIIEHQLGGAVRRAAWDATAFAHRDVEYSFMSLGVCADPRDAERCVRWAREFWTAAQPYSSGGVYVNYLGQEADEGPDRIKAAYDPEKYARLVALKNKYDPMNLFRLNQNIRPTGRDTASASAAV